MSKTTTSNEEREFGGRFLEDILSYIEENFNPLEVYEFKDLKEWAQDYLLEEICDLEDLQTWAEENGYVKESE